MYLSRSIEIPGRNNAVGRKLLNKQNSVEVGRRGMADVQKANNPKSQFTTSSEEEEAYRDERVSNDDIHFR